MNRKRSHFETCVFVGKSPNSEWLLLLIGLVGAPACGDVMKLQVEVDENGTIVDAKFKTFGCGSAIGEYTWLHLVFVDSSLLNSIIICCNRMVEGQDSGWMLVHQGKVAFLETNQSYVDINNMYRILILLRTWNSLLWSFIAQCWLKMLSRPQSRIWRPRIVLKCSIYVIVSFCLLLLLIFLL